MSKAPVATMSCPLSVAAGEPHQAEVFVQAGRKASLYWRCACGTMQPLMSTGQALIKRVAKPLTVEQRDTAAAGAATDAAADAKDQAKAVKRELDPISKFFDALLGGSGSDA